MAEKQWPTFSVVYNMDGSQWSIDVIARDADDAKRRIAGLARWLITGDGGAETGGNAEIRSAAVIFDTHTVYAVTKRLVVGKRLTYRVVNQS